MAWEALNNIADSHRPVIIVVNDNERSYAPTIGGLARHLDTLRTTRGYERFLDWGKDMLGRTPVVGAPLFEALHGVKRGVKDVVAPQGMFEDLGLKYLGPVDGHDVASVESVLRAAKRYDGPVIVHVITAEGSRVRARGERRGGPLPRCRDHRPGDGDPGQQRRPDLDRGLRRRARGDRSRAARRRGDHRRHAVPDRPGPVRRRVPRSHLRRGHRRAARPDLRRRHGLSPGCTRWSRSTPPS